MLDFLNIYWVLAITALTWHYVLFCGFVSDDHAVIEARKDIIPDAEKIDKGEKYWLKVFNDGVILFYLNRLVKSICGSNPFGWHLLSFSIHLANTFLLYRVSMMFVPEPIALLATLIWSVNPMQNQIVGWCSGRPYGISAMFALIMLLFWQHPYVTIPLFVLALITSVSIGFTPILLAVLHPNTWQGTFYVWVLVACIPFVLWKFQRRFAQNALVLDRENFHFKKRRFFNMARVYMYYIMSMIFPVRMGWYHDAGFSYNKKWDGFNIWALAGFIVVYVFCHNVLGLWFLLGLLPQMNIFATNSYVQDRYIYFGSMGFALLVTPYIPSLLYIVAVAIYISKSYTYSRHMISDETLYKENWRNHPKADYAINNLSFFLIQQRRYEEARAFINRGLEINKDNKLLWYNLGVTWAATASLGNEDGIQRFFRAMECWKRALHIEPRWRKPLEDMQKVVKVLIDNKILTTDQSEAVPGMPAIHTPAMDKEAFSACDTKT
jgi:tetratricopeptide (TPR) repeat protein